MSIDHFIRKDDFVNWFEHDMTLLTSLTVALVDSRLHFCFIQMILLPVINLFERNQTFIAAILLYTLFSDMLLTILWIENEDRMLKFLFISITVFDGTWVTKVYFSQKYSFV